MCKKSSNFVPQNDIFMKKFFFIAFLSLAMVSLNGCRECNCTPGKDCTCTPHPDCKFHQKTIDLVVNSNEWQWDEATQRFYAHFTQPDITVDIYDYATWTFTHEYNFGTKDAYQVALPESVFKSETLQDNSVVTYFEHIDYAIGIGWVEVTYTISDFVYPEQSPGVLINPGDMRFHLQLNY